MNPHDSELHGLKAIVTGASRGIGEAIARALAERGTNLFLTARSGDRLEALARELSASAAGTAEIVTFPADLSDPDVPARLVRAAAERLGGIDILVNNAGIAESMPFEETDLAAWERHFAINARAPFLLCREAIPWLRRSVRPTVIQIASVTAHEGYPGQAAYSASKHALLGFTKAFAREVQQDGIRVHVVSPGGVATGMITDVRPDLEASGLIDPEEIARTVLFLLENRGNAAVDEIRIRRSGKEPW